MSLPVRALALALVPLFLVTGCETTPYSPSPGGAERANPDDPAAAIARNKRERDAVVRVMDGWHQAAAKGDIDAYFGHLAEDATFLGTDATERWSKEEFHAYTKAVHDPNGTMWNIQPFDRFLVIEGEHAWIDEGLRHENYSDWRGTGVLRKSEDGWQIVHYSMTFTIPNDLTPAVKQLVLDYLASLPDPR